MSSLENPKENHLRYIVEKRENVKSSQEQKTPVRADFSAEAVDGVRKTGGNTPWTLPHILPLYHSFTNMEASTPGGT